MYVLSTSRRQKIHKIFQVATVKLDAVSMFYLVESIACACLLGIRKFYLKRTHLSSCSSIYRCTDILVFRLVVPRSLLKLLKETEILVAVTLPNYSGGSRSWISARYAVFLKYYAFSILFMVLENFIYIPWIFLLCRGNLRKHLDSIDISEIFLNNTWHLWWKCYTLFWRWSVMSTSVSWILVFCFPNISNVLYQKQALDEVYESYEFSRLCWISIYYEKVQLQTLLQKSSCLHQFWFEKLQINLDWKAFPCGKTR